MKLFPLLPVGIIIGIIVTADPFISNIISNVFDIDFKIIPFQFTLVVGLLILAVSSGYCKYSKFIIKNKEKILIILIIASPQLKSFSLGGLEIADILILFFIGIWFFDGLRKNQFLLNTPLHFLFFLFAGVSLLSCVNGGMGSLLMTIRISKSIVYALLLTGLIKDRHDIIWTLKILFVITAISSVIAILQEFLFLTTGIVAVGNISEDARSMMMQKTSFGMVIRPPALFAHQAAFARTLSIIIPILFAFILNKGTEIYVNKKTYFPLLVLMIIAMFLTISRPTWIAILTGLTICLYLKKPSLIIHYLTAIVLLISIAHFTGLTTELQKELYEEMFLAGDLYDRVVLASESLQKIGRHPIIGVGVGKASRYTANIHNWPAHNGFIYTMVSTGILGFAAFSFSFLYMFLRLGAIYISKNTNFAMLAYSMLCGVSSYIVTIQFMPASMDYIYLTYIIAITASIICQWKTSVLNIPRRNRIEKLI